MININLLPWREKKIEIENRKFVFSAIVVSLIVAVLMLLYSFLFRGILIKENQDYNYLKKEIYALEGSITKIKDLDAQREGIFARKEIIRELQYIRTLIPEIFDNLAEILPANILIENLKMEGFTLKMSGVGLGNQDVSLLMNKINELHWVQKASLTEIKHRVIESQQDAKADLLTSAGINLDVPGSVFFMVHIDVREFNKARD
jgi:Tfp pilus assembly protein PilN